MTVDDDSALGLTFEPLFQLIESKFQKLNAVWDSLTKSAVYGEAGTKKLLEKVFLDENLSKMQELADLCEHYFIRCYLLNEKVLYEYVQKKSLLKILEIYMFAQFFY